MTESIEEEPSEASVARTNEQGRAEPDSRALSPPDKAEKRESAEFQRGASIASSTSSAGDNATEAHRPQANRYTSAASTVKSERRAEIASLAPLKRRHTKLANKKAHPFEHLGITLGLPMILLFDIIVPCIIYYTWYNSHRSKRQRDCTPFHSRGDICPIPKREFDKDILGSAIASFGVGELWILIARVWRLFFRRDQCAPLLSRNRWELDATSWVYGVAMILALIPFIVGSSLVMPKLYLYSPSFIMGFLGLLMLFTTIHPFNFKLPIGINSQPRGTELRPFIYYAAEDFVAVDGLQDREFRIRFNERYESSRMFRRMFVHLTLWWELGVCVYIGTVSAVIWTLEFHYAFGLSLGVLFAYIAVWAGVTYAWVIVSMKRQDKAYEEGKDGV